VKTDVKPPAKAVGETLTRASGGRDGVSTMGDLFGDLDLEGLGAAQMNDLGGVTHEILAAPMEILAENEVSDSGEDTMGEDSEDDESVSGKGTHNPAAPELKSGSRIVCLGQEGDEMRLGYVVAVHGDGKGGPPFYTAYLEGLGKNRLKDSECFQWLLQMISPPVSAPVPSHSSSRASQYRKEKKEKTNELHLG
jgi:hypothetical protein